MNGGAEDFVTRKEFETATKYYDRAMSDMGLSNDRRAAEVRDELRRLAELIRSTAAAAPAVDSSSLAMQRMMDMMERRGGKGGVWQIGAVLVAAVFGYLFLHHWNLL